MDYKNFYIERDGNITIIIFDRPDINNAMENPLFRIELTQILDSFAADPEQKVAIIKNKGKFFCSGGNLKKFYNDLTGDQREAFLKEFHQRVVDGEALISKIYMMPKPIIASVNGVAAGGGANLALSCDFVFISNRTSFIQSFININIIPDTGGLWTLSKRVGLSKAKYLAMTGEVVKAPEALAMGLADKVFQEDELYSSTIEFARMLASKPPDAIAGVKRLSNMIPELSRADYIETEAKIMAKLFAQQETLKRISAFVNKNK